MSDQPEIWTVRRGIGTGDRLVSGTMSEDEHQALLALDALVARLAESEARAARAEPIFAERDRQDVKWGGPVHDDIHTSENFTVWIDFINEHAGKAYSPDDGDESRKNFRRRMVEVGALALAAVESMDRVHPDAALAAVPPPAAGKELVCRCGHPHINPDGSGSCSAFLCHCESFAA